MIGKTTILQPTPASVVATAATVAAATAAVKAGLSYSTSETATGTTFLGSNVYQVVVPFGAGPGPGASVNVGHGVVFAGILSLHAIFTDGSTFTAAPTPGNVGMGGTVGDLTLYADAGRVYADSVAGDYSGQAGAAILTYYR